jgi:hypothetical protein
VRRGVSQLLLRRFCGLLSVCCVCRKGKIVNRTAHFFVFLGVNFREFSFEKLILLQVHLNGYERAQVWPSAATAQREWTPAILPTSSTLLKPIFKKTEEFVVNFKTNSIEITGNISIELLSKEIKTQK